MPGAERQNNSLLTHGQALELAKSSPDGLRRAFAKMRGPELGHLLLACENDEQRRALLQYIPDDRRGDALLELPEALQEGLLSSLHPHEIEAVVEHLDSDDATDILQAVNESVANEVIERLEPEDRREIEPLLEHDKAC